MGETYTCLAMRIKPNDDNHKQILKHTCSAHRVLKSKLLGLAPPNLIKSRMTLELGTFSLGLGHISQPDLI